jgi:hypothetical protein
VSTYYSMVCDKCRQEVSLASVGMLGSARAMGEHAELLAFLTVHLNCGEDDKLPLRVVSEHSREYEDYAEFQPQEALD